MGLILGRHSYIATHMLSHDPAVNVGNFTSMAQGITFHGRDNHTTNTVSTFPWFTLYPETKDLTFSKGPILIGNDVWVGDKVSFLSGVTVGDGAVVGARSVVSKDCIPYGVYVGNPAKLVKLRFNPEIIVALHAIRWWAWPDEKIAENIEWFFKPVEEFVEEFGVR